MVIAGYITLSQVKEAIGIGSKDLVVQPLLFAQFQGLVLPVLALWVAITHQVPVDAGSGLLADEVSLRVGAGFTSWAWLGAGGLAIVGICVDFLFLSGKPMVKIVTSCHI